MTLNPVTQAFASISTDLLDSLKKYIECKQVRGSSLSGGSWPDKGRWDGGVMTECKRETERVWLFHSHFHLFFLSPGLLFTSCLRAPMGNHHGQHPRLFSLKQTTAGLKHLQFIAEE